MGSWVISGIRTGIKSTHYPAEEEIRPGVSPGMPVAGTEQGRETEICPTGALVAAEGKICVDYRKCIHCFRCSRGTGLVPLDWQQGYEWGARASAEEPALDTARFGRSLHVRVVDAGDCGACLSEISQLNNPYYNMHRLGFFITPSPRSADILLVVGPLTDQMRDAVKKTYDAMPTPKRVVAVGACAVSGGIFGPSFTSSAGIADIVPVDVAIPGCPPPPLAILHGLLVAVGRKPPADITSPPSLERQREVPSWHSTR